MTVYKFLKPALRSDPTGVTLYQDAGLRIVAAVTGPNGAPLPGSKLDRLANGDWPAVTASLPILYYRNGNGMVTSISPTVDFATVVSVTGAKGSNAALASLISALVKAGLPITDNTTA